MKILIHATLYPESENEKRANTTMFAHYYAAEWVKQGHEALVLHHKTAFPRFMERVGRAISKNGKIKIISEYLNGYGEDGSREFIRDGVRIIRLRTLKILPRLLHSRRFIKKRADEAAKILTDKNFKPDITFCDFVSPGLFVALEIKKQTTSGLL